MVPVPVHGYTNIPLRRTRFATSWRASASALSEYGRAPSVKRTPHGRNHGKRVTRSINPLRFPCAPHLSRFLAGALPKWARMTVPPHVRPHPCEVSVSYSARYQCIRRCPGRYNVLDDHRCPACDGLLEVVHDTSALRQASAWARRVAHRFTARSAIGSGHVHSGVWARRRMGAAAGQPGAHRYVGRGLHAAAACPGGAAGPGVGASGRSYGPGGAWSVIAWSFWRLRG